VLDKAEIACEEILIDYSKYSERFLEGISIRAFQESSIEEQNQPQNNENNSTNNNNQNNTNNGLLLGSSIKQVSIEKETGKEEKKNQ
jgi:hypothetical protein